MSLITSCPACGTMFRVVPDQLRISDGWVRCGQCAEIFDATAHMAEHSLPLHDEGPATQPSDIATQPPDWDLPPAMQPPAPAATAPFPPWPGPPRAESPVPRAEPPAAALAARAAATAPRGATQPMQAAGAVTTRPLPAVGAPTQPGAGMAAEPLVRDLSAVEVAPSEPSAGMRAAELDAAWSPPQVMRTGPDSRPAEPSRPSRPIELRSEAVRSAEREPALEEVSFVRQARRRAFWRRPSVRIFLVLVGFLLAAALVLQLAYDERNRLAATQPQLRPALERMCDFLRCQVAPPRQIEAIVIENSAFSRVRGDTYRLSFTLRNTAPYEVSVPAMELTLTDTQDQAVLRRVLLPAELGARQPPVLDAAAEWSSSVGLAVNAPGGARVAGYRLLAFYP